MVSTAYRVSVFQQSYLRNTTFHNYIQDFQTVDDVNWKRDEYQSFIAPPVGQTLFWSDFDLTNWYYHVEQK
jgi:hypothetical protein